MLILSDFIADFRSSGLVEHLQSKYDVIMIWVSGSTAIGITDDNSDYDIGVLVADPVTFSKTKKHPETYIYNSGEHKVSVQCVFNALDDVAAELCMGVLAPYRYLGWAQFKYISDDFIIFKNENYLDIINELITSKDEISKNAIYAFLEFWQPKMKLAKASVYVPVIKWGKMLSHICWCVEELEGVPHNPSLLLKIKRAFSQHNNLNYLTTEQSDYAYDKIVVAQKFLREKEDTSSIKALLDGILLKLDREYLTNTVEEVY